MKILTKNIVPLLYHNKNLFNSGIQVTAIHFTPPHPLKFWKGRTGVRWLANFFNFFKNDYFRGKNENLPLFWIKMYWWCLQTPVFWFIFFLLVYFNIFFQLFFSLGVVYVFLLLQELYNFSIVYIIGSCSSSLIFFFLWVYLLIKSDHKYTYLTKNIYGLQKK